jgi:hypothetical protein
MRSIIFFAPVLFLACNNHSTSESPRDTAEVIANNKEKQGASTDTVARKIYANQRFRNVSVDRIGVDSFRLRGEGQIFEASFSWILEDGHEELQKGFHTTDAGAPEWGKFDFTIQAKKKRPNSSLTIVLFETSAMDGSRQHELPIALF